jgi:hypothetical protein
MTPPFNTEDVSMTFEKALDQELAIIRDTLLKKQSDYGPQNIAEFGEVGILVRTNDKVARLRNLVGRKTIPSCESISDSWKDLAGYGVLAMMWRRGTFLSPMESSLKGESTKEAKSHE